MKSFVALATVSLLLFGHVSVAQSDSLQQQINTQVWKPFIKSYNQLDADGFMSVHSKDLTRVIRDDNKIYGYAQYFTSMTKGNEYSKQNKHTRAIELRFMQRIADNDKAYETGYYKVVATGPDGKSRAFYGKFVVLLRKEKGVWKILMDSDANENTDENVFQSAKPM